MQNFQLERCLSWLLITRYAPLLTHREKKNFNVDISIWTLSICLQTNLAIKIRRKCFYLVFVRWSWWRRTASQNQVTNRFLYLLLLLCNVGKATLLAKWLIDYTAYFHCLPVIILLFFLCIKIGIVYMYSKMWLIWFYFVIRSVVWVYHVIIAYANFAHTARMHPHP